MSLSFNAMQPLETVMTCKGIERATFGAAASLMATLVMASVGLLFAVPGSAAAQPVSVTAPRIG
jgi:CBS-domain-containing membrane protein